MVLLLFRAYQKSVPSKVRPWTPDVVKLDRTVPVVVTSYVRSVVLSATQRFVPSHVRPIGFGPGAAKLETSVPVVVTS